MIRGQRKKEEHRAAVEQYVERIIAEQQDAGNPDPDQSGDEEPAAGNEAAAAPDL